MTEPPEPARLWTAAQVARYCEQALEELEERLRQELADAVAELNARVDNVHARALRELTRLTEARRRQ